MVQLIRQVIEEDLSQRDSSRFLRLVKAPPLHGGQPKKQAAA